MKPARFLPLMLALVAVPAVAQIDPVAIRVPKPKAWTGQRLPFFVELRARGSFAGAANFSLPKIPRTVITTVGDPVVSSREVDGESWFVQTHEFALFSQQTGVVEIPSFEVRFRSRDGFTGPAHDRQAKVLATKVQIERPPDSDPFGFLITTDSMEITETWHPKPGPSKLGAVFTRTILQRAEHVTGMAFAPPTTTAPEGVRVYLGKPEVSDQTERGALVGTRRDTITYVLQEPGTLTLPPVTYVWWNPKVEQLRSKTLPAITFDVAAPAEIPAARTHSAARRIWFWWVAAGLSILAISARQRRRILAEFNRWWHILNPPDRVTARALYRACRRHDAVAAAKAWTQWFNLQPTGFHPLPDLRKAVLEMHRYLFGRSSAGPWKGHELKKAFRAQRNQLRPIFTRNTIPALPRLNSNGCTLSRG